MDNKRQRFKQIIKQIESSGGKNFDHKEIESGIHEGDKAIGSYGLMPNTVDEMLVRNPIPYSPKEIKKIKTMDAARKKAYLESNPSLEETLVDKLYDKTDEKVDGDELKQAAAWMYGHNRNLESPFYKEGKYLDTDYVKKYQNLMPKERDIAQIPQEESEEESTLASLFKKLKNLKD